MNCKDLERTFYTIIMEKSYNKTPNLFYYVYETSRVSIIRFINNKDKKGLS